MDKRLDPLITTLNQYDQRLDLLKGLNSLPPMHQLPHHFRLFVENPKLAEIVYFYFLPLLDIKSGNGKTAPALRILLEAEMRGELSGKLGYGASSGNTAANWARMAPWFKMKGFVAVVERGIFPGKKGQLEMAGAVVQHPPKGMSTIEYAAIKGSEKGCWIANQYEDWASVRAHELSTWPHVQREMQRLERDPSVGCLAMGTTSALVSALYLKKTWPGLELFGTACISEEEKIPGARTIEGLKVTRFGYQDVVDDKHIIFCDKRDAYAMSRELYRQGFSAGPTTGMALAGFLGYLNRTYRMGGMPAVEKLRNQKGDIVFVGLAMDAAVSYATEYTTVLR